MLEGTRGCGQMERRGLAAETTGTDLGSCCADLAGVAPSGARWTCLQLDLQDILLVYLNRRYGHLKSVRLCASLLVKSLYTSDLCFEPGRRRSPYPALLPQRPLPLPVCASPPSVPGFSAGGAGIAAILEPPDS